MFITNVDSQASISGGVLVQVLGEMSNHGDCQKFCQTFFLAEQPTGYYVLNNIFRFLKEDIDAEYEEVEDGVEKTTTFTFQDEKAKSAAAQTQKRPASPVKQEVKPKEEKKTVPVAQPSTPVTQPSPVPKEATPQPAPQTKPVPSAPVTQAEVQPTPVSPQPAQQRPPSPKKEAKSSAPVAWAKIAAANSETKPVTPPQQPKAVPAPQPMQQQPQPQQPKPQPVQTKPGKKEDDESDGFKEITRRQPERRQSQASDGIIV